MDQGVNPYSLKSQEVRLLDVFIFAPFMLYSASQIPAEYRAARTLLALFGGATLSYNWVNYLRAQESQR